MMYKISITQTHLNAEQWVAFFDELFPINSEHKERLHIDGHFTIHAYDLENVLDRIGSTWAEKFAIYSEDSSNVAGPVLRMNVEPVTNLREQFAVASMNDMNTVVIGTLEAEQRRQREVMQQMLGGGSAVANGDGIMRLLQMLVDDEEPQPKRS